MPGFRDERAQRRRLAVAIVLALSLHGAVALAGLVGSFELAEFARRVQGGMDQRLRASIQIALEKEPEPPPEPKPEEPADPPPKPEPKAPVQKAQRPEPEPPAPAAAQAGRVLTAEPDPDEPVDLTGTTFVQGNADAYVGGVTAASGTSTRAVRAPAARAAGVPGGTGSAPASGVDRSRAAGLADLFPDCPFPPGAEPINNYRVSLAVTLSTAGKPLDVQVLGNPDADYARAAKLCAGKMSYVPALDRGGSPLATTISIVVNFKLR